MNIKNASTVNTMYQILTDLKIRHIGGDLFIEAVSPPILSAQPVGPSFMLFDMERTFAVVIQESGDGVPGIMFSPVILAELQAEAIAPLSNMLRMKHSETKEMSLLIAYWFMRAKSVMGKQDVMRFLRTTYGDIATVTWGNMEEPMADMERFLRNLKVPIAA